MPRTLELYATCFITDLSLRVAAHADSGHLQDLRATADISLHPEWQLHLEEQTEWWRFPLLYATAQHNAEFTIQLSYRPLARTTQ